ncbi:MAG TPA: trypsin-like serine protease [Thermoanaerobaculia bacterium]|jgi:hypothetical protein
MRRLSLFLLCLFLAASAHAITFGFVDDTNQFSNVGAFVVQSSTGRNFIICSGTLITSNVFLTASHCTDFYLSVLQPRGFTAFVSFDPLIPEGSQTSSKTKLLAVSDVVQNPLFNQAQSDTGDIAVLILEKPVKGLVPATLPECGLLDRLFVKGNLNDAVFTAVGYGVQERRVGGGPPSFKESNPVPRMFAFSSFDALNPTFIRLSQNPATGDGGTCFGDSGGPNFLDVNGQQILAAITITGDTVCQATNVDYRTDTPSAQQFFSYVNATFGTSIPVSSC